MHNTLILAALLFLAGSIAPPQPFVSDFNGDIVRIQIASYGDPKDAKALSQNEADRICAKRGRWAEYASTRTLPDYNWENLYLCL